MKNLKEKLTKIDLEKEMLKNNKPMPGLPKEGEDILQKANEILSKQPEEDQKLLNEFGFTAYIKQKKLWEDERDSINRKNSQINKFPKEKVFHINQIRLMACRYDLKFLPTNMFIGDLPPELPQKIKAFKKEFFGEMKIPEYVDELDIELRMEIQEHLIHRFPEIRNLPDKIEDLPHRLKIMVYSELEEEYSKNIRYDFRVLAPPNNFEKMKASEDPLLFYKIDDNYYYLIHKWGNDLSITRRVKGFLLKNSARVWGVVLNCLMLIALLFSYDIAAVIGSFSIPFWVVSWVSPYNRDWMNLIRIN